MPIGRLWETMKKMNDRHLTRRDWLTSARGSEPRSSGARGASPGSGELLVQFSRPAMGCTFEVLLPRHDRARAAHTVLDALDLVDHLEDVLSHHRPTSELAEVNAKAAREPVPVSQTLWDVLERSAWFYRETEGAFDITTMPLSRLWGFHHRQGRLPQPDEIESVLEVVGMDHVRLTSDRYVSYDRTGVEIGFASIGKGYAIDQASAILSAGGLEDFVIHGGYSSIRASGSAPASPDGGGWPIAVRHPLRPERLLGTITLANEALATSGLANQSFLHAGRRYGHVIDPRTGYPASDLLSVTVVADSAADADAWATALLVVGPEGAKTLCRQHGLAGAVLVRPSGGPELDVEIIGLEGKWTAAQ